MTTKKLRHCRLAVAVGLVVATASYSASAFAGECNYVIENSWSSGFVASIQIKNTESTDITDWKVSWTFDVNSVERLWSANLAGSYEATPLHWNKVIKPGQTVEFGFKGNTNGGAIETPVIEGAACGMGDTGGGDTGGGDTGGGDTGGGDTGGGDTGGGDTGGGDTGGGDTGGGDTGGGDTGGGDTGGGDTGGGDTGGGDTGGGDTGGGDTGGGDTGGGDTGGGDTTGEFRVNESGNITKDGVEMPVQCGNWFGLEGRHEPSSDPTNPSGAPLELYVGNTFWANGGSGTGRTIQQTMTEIKGMGMNVIRLPIAPQTLNPDDPQGKAPFLKNHPSVRATNARQEMEDFIKLADQNDIQVIVDIHSCSNYLGWRAGRLDARPPYVDVPRQNYDYLREDYSCAATNNPDSVEHIQEYNKEIWLDNLREIAGLSTLLDVDNILGIDVYNEPWDYSWADWKELTEAAYVAINEVNPNVLIFVEGISDSYNNQDGNPDSNGRSPHGDLTSTPNWGENFYEFRNNRLDIPKERLVISPHAYGPSVAVQPMFMDPSQPECEGLSGHAAGEAKCNIVIEADRLTPGWEEHFGYLRDEGYAVVMGEFGGNMDWPNKAALGDQQLWGEHITPGVDQQWQEVFADYMVEKGIQGCYWGMNPESGDTGGWYDHAYDPISNEAGWGEWLDFDQRKTNILNRIWGQSSAN